jgi:ankyrin repeat protein
MHDDDGVSVRAESLISYAEALERLLKGALDDLNRRAAHDDLEKEDENRRVKNAKSHIWNAIQRNDIKAVAALVTQGWNMDTLSPEGKTLLQYAKELGRFDIAKLFREKTNRV